MLALRGLYLGFSQRSPEVAQSFQLLAKRAGELTDTFIQEPRG